MKSSKLLWLLLFAVFPVAVFAADALTTMSLITPGDGVAAAATGAAPALPFNSILSWLTPILVPIVLAGVKKALPSIPSGVIPYLAPLLGALVSIIDTALLHNPSNIWVGFGLGALGVAVREMKEGVMKAGNGGWPVPNP